MKTCEKIVRENGDIYFRPKERKEFKEESYASVQGNKKEGYYIYAVKGQKGYNLGYDSKDGFLPRFSKTLAIKHAKEWLKKEGVC